MAFSLPWRCPWRRCARLAAPSVLALLAGAAAAQGLTPVQQRARDLYQELVEINTITATGDTLRAAQAMAARLQAAGFGADDVQVLSPGPRKGNLVARFRGSGARRPMLLLAHIDVVSASAEDWSFEPFRLLEKDGYFYGRGVADNKYMAAAFVAAFIRYREEGLKPERDLILVLETDEETLDANKQGIRWLLEHHRPLIDAEFALNEGGGVGMDAAGRPLLMALQTSEKVSMNFQLEVRNPGGHSSLPTRDNAIYRLADALARLARHEFPLQLNDTTRAFFERMSELGEDQPLRADMKAVIQPKPDPAAVERLSRAPGRNAILRTTCVATELRGGHAANALPQTARATVNCRVMPGVPAEEVLQTLRRAVADEQVAVTLTTTPVPSPPSPLNAELMRTIERVAADFWPGIPLVPTMLAAATDGSYLRNAGIPTYGHSGLLANGTDMRAHGRDERIPVASFHAGHEYLYRLVKALAGTAR